MRPLLQRLRERMEQQESQKPRQPGEEEEEEEEEGGEASGDDESAALLRPDLRRDGLRGYLESGLHLQDTRQRQINARRAILYHLERANKVQQQCALTHNQVSEVVSACITITLGASVPSLSLLGLVSGRCLAAG
jgi:hypothetical protein